MKCTAATEPLDIGTPDTQPRPLSRVSEHALKQEPRRKQECAARHRAVRFVEQCVSSCRSAADYLHVSRRTLTSWRSHKAHGKLQPQLRGRPCRAPSAEQRLEVEAILQDTGPGLAIPTLQKHCPEIPRCVLAYVLTGYRRRFQAEHHVVVQKLRWRRPGSVWALDHSEPPCAIDGYYGQILAVRDLSSGMQLAWTPVRDATAEHALWLLKLLVAQHGAPLVLKSDNGAAFTSRSFGQWLARSRIIPLFSPVRMPRYNGACEAGIGGMKRRTEQIAAHHDRLLEWPCDDMYAAQLWANDDHYAYGLTAGVASSRFAARMPLDDHERTDFEATLRQCEQDFRRDLCSEGGAITDKLSALCHRRAVRHALVEHDYLSITRRSIPQPIMSAKCA